MVSGVSIGKYLRAGGLLVGLSLLSSAWAAAPVVSMNSAIPPSDTPVQATTDSEVSTPLASPVRSLTIEQRLTKLENQQNYYRTLEQNLETVQNQVSAMQSQLEELQHEVDSLKALGLDVANLKKNVGARPAAGPVASIVKSPTPAVTAGPDMSDKSAYTAAYQSLLNKEYAGSLQGFNDFVKNYPKSPRLGQAYYWMGELYLAQGQPDQAAQYFNKAAHEKGNVKAPDALVKLGMIDLSNGDSAHAKKLFQKVIARYPKTDAADLAAEKLKPLSSPAS